jgi:hypothetical protein
VTGLAFDPSSGLLYGSTNNQSPTAPSSLILINPTTALATLVGSYGTPNQTMADLTFRPDGTLYGWLEASTDSLFTINKLTGAVSLVGSSGIGTYGSGLASDAAGTLYYTGSGTGSVLRTINPVTGLPTVVATLSGGVNFGDPINALAFDSSGVLFGVENAFASAAYLTSIDTSTGLITVRGQSIDRLDAIAFQADSISTPEPSTIVSLGIAGLIALGYGVRRRRKSN